MCIIIVMNKTVVIIIKKNGLYIYIYMLTSEKKCVCRASKILRLAMDRL